MDSVRWTLESNYTFKNSLNKIFTIFGPIQKGKDQVASRVRIYSTLSACRCVFYEYVNFLKYTTTFWVKQVDYVNKYLMISQAT